MTANREYLFPQCIDCMCQYCGYRSRCTIMEGNTEWYCKEICKGEESSTIDCSLYEPTINKHRKEYEDA